MRRLTLDVSKWHVLQHREARDLEPASIDDGREVQLQDEVFERLYAGDSDVSRLAETDQSEHAAWAQRLHDTAAGLPDFSRLAGLVRGDADASACATETLAGLLEPMMRKQEQEQKKPQRPGKPQDLDGALRRAVRGACAAAGKAVEEFRDAQDAAEGIGLGAGKSDDGESGQAVHPMRYRELARLMGGNGRLKRILDIAGRLKRIAARKQRERVIHGADEIADVEQGCDLGRLLPAELARLSHPTLRLAFLRDFTERQCLQYQLRGNEEKGRGPIVVLLDKSGSMDWERDEWATAVALAMLSVARRERRTFALLCYKYSVTFEAIVEAGGQLPEDALFQACGGGTSVDRAVDRALAIIAEHPGQIAKADIVIVSDGDDSNDDATLRERAKALGVTTYGIGVAGCADMMRPWCDEVFNVYDMATVSDEVAGKVFAV